MMPTHEPTIPLLLAVKIFAEEPVWLWAVAPAAAVTIGGAWLINAVSPLRRWVGVAVRLVLLLVIGALLAGVSAQKQTDRVAVIGLVDVSASVSRLARLQTGAGGVQQSPEEAVRAFLLGASAGRRPDDAMGVVAFAGVPMVAAPPQRADVSDRPWDAVVPESTDIAAAIRTARGLIPADATGRVVLFTDGNQTLGDAVRAAEEAAADARTRGVPPLAIDVVPLSFRLEQEVAIDSVDAPPSAGAESSVSVRVVLSATSPASGTLRLLVEGAETDINGDAAGLGRRVELREGLNAEVLQVRLPPGRVHRFRAVFEPDEGDDSVIENNSGEAFTISPGRGTVVIVDGVGGGDESGAGATLLRALRDGGLDASMVGPDAVPRDVLSLQSIDLMILQNVAAEDVDPATQELLASYVRDMGGGLIMVGGPDSFGAGGWKGSPIEPLLPVNLEVPDKLVSSRAATVFVLDNSGSMRLGILGTGRTQQQLANDAAALAIRTLDRRDLVGVITFNSRERLLVPLKENSNPDETVREVLSIAPGGGTNAPPALVLANQLLRDVEARVKHVVLLSDGRSQDHETLPRLARALADDGIKVSAIAVGDRADLRTMSEMADQGGGTYAYAASPEALPRLFLRAIRVVRAPLVKEVPFQPVVENVGSPVLLGMQVPPPLNGLVLTSARTEPTIVNAMRTPEGEPVLAHWNAGLGRVGAFTSDASSWAEPWLDWPGYRQFWQQFSRAMSRSVVREPVQTQAVAGDGLLRVRAEARREDGAPWDGLRLPATVFGPDGRASEVVLNATAPGVYEGTAPAERSGSYVVLARPMDGETPLAPSLVGATVRPGEEFRFRSSNDALLIRIAEVSGGRVLSLADPAGARLFSREGLEPRRAVVPLWPVLLPLSLALLWLDIATRRIAWDRWVSKRFGADLSKAARESIQSRGERAERFLTKVKEAEPTVATPEPAIALSDADARKLRDAARDRRRAAKLSGPGPSVVTESQPAASAGATASERSAEKAAKPEVQVSEAAEEPGSLLAAKRRARKKFEDEQTGQG